MLTNKYNITAVFVHLNYMISLYYIMLQFSARIIRGEVGETI